MHTNDEPTTTDDDLTGGPVFPRLASLARGDTAHAGLTLRDYFAGVALVAGAPAMQAYGHAARAAHAYHLAAAMIRARRDQTD